MPVRRCVLEGKPGFKWGEQGKCYTYEPGDAAEREKAKKRAEEQGSAAHAAGFEEE